MEYLSSSEEIKEKLIFLIQECTSMQIATAWGTTNNKVFNELSKNSSKIQKLIVGTHFYQTDPKFLEYFINEENVKVVKQTSGVFHPKIYFFLLSDGWECVIGSANFTNAAFTINDEIAVSISDYDRNSDKTKNEIMMSFAKWNKLSEIIDEDFLEKYKLHYEAKKHNIEQLSNKSDKSDGNSFKSHIFSLTWDDYITNIKLLDFNGEEGIIQRIKILEESEKMFDSKESFNDLDNISQKKISGFYEKQNESIDWLLFGSMKGSGEFKKVINSNSKLIGKAIDSIPLKGIVNKLDYKKFVEKFNETFDDNKNRLATSTRLLAIKRPDYFICLDSANKKSFCKDFGIENEINLNNYWEEVVDRIKNCLWWNKEEAELSDGIEKSIWKGRTAFLDSLYYKNIVRVDSKPYIQEYYPDLISDRIKITSSRKYEQLAKMWWLKFSMEDLKTHDFIVFAGALDYENKGFRLLKVPTKYILDNIDKLDVNANGYMINLYVKMDTFIDIRNKKHLEFKDFVLNERVD